MLDFLGDAWMPVALYIMLIFNVSLILSLLKIRRTRKKQTSEDGDIYLNPFFGDLWVVDGKTYIKINDGYTVDRDEPEGFVKVGHISDVVNKEFSDFEAVDHEDDNAQ